MAEKIHALPEFHFDRASEKYWMKLQCGTYLKLDGRNAKLHMMSPDFMVKRENDFGLKDGDAVLRKTQLEKWIDYAGPLAGCKSGLTETIDGRRILVTSQARPVIPKNGPTRRIEKFLTQLFGDKQLPHVLFWLKVAHASLLRGIFQPGQLFAMAGPPGCGKSFMHVLITMLLGGRVAKPYRYMVGETHFNSDLAGAEHLIIEDENAQSGTAARRKFGQAIKDWTVNEVISVHAKGREALPLCFYRRLSLSVNDETENLLIIPPMDNSIADKVMLFRCQPAALDEDRAENIGMLKKELPGLAQILKETRIPERYKDTRFGVKAYHDAWILEILSDASPENQLDDIINEVLKKDFKANNSWEGPAIELVKELSDSAFRYAIDRLLTYPAACGTYLARLESKFPERFSKTKNKGQTIWHIKER